MLLFLQVALFFTTIPLSSQMLLAREFLRFEYNGFRKIESKKGQGRWAEDKSEFFAEIENQNGLIYTKDYIYINISLVNFTLISICRHFIWFIIDLRIIINFTLIRYILAVFQATFYTFIEDSLCISSWYIYIDWSWHVETKKN